MCMRLKNWDKGEVHCCNPSNRNLGKKKLRKC